MKIAVIAANGRLGRVFVEEALMAGHIVRAGVRGQSNFVPHPNLEVIRCDATDPQDLKSLLQGQDVVVSCLGHVRGSAADVQTVATRAIIQVMLQLGIVRFVDVTGTGVRVKGDKIGIVDLLLNLAITIIDPARVKDGRDHSTILQNSSLDWTTIRVLKLQNSPAKPFSLNLHGPTKWLTGRREVARAMLQVIEQHEFIKQTPIICKPIKEKK
jgi:putative NADH-flavin reductase